MGFSVSWMYMGASVKGTAHHYSDTPCQDSHQVGVEAFNRRKPLLYVLAADGAGSAPYSQKGAQLAMETAVVYWQTYYRNIRKPLKTELAHHLLTKIQQVINAYAKQQGHSSREYACTFLGAVTYGMTTLLMQIGDGGIALDTGQGLTIPIKPMVGEYANMTHFITDEEASTRVCVELIKEPLKRVAVFTDGVQRLAMNLATNQAHEPFFKPFFNALSQHNLTQVPQLNQALEGFLNSEAVNSRTDDDKTLALALWTGST